MFYMVKKYLLVNGTHVMHQLEFNGGDIPTCRFWYALGCLDVKHTVLLANNTTFVHRLALFNYRNTKQSLLVPTPRF